MALIIIGPTASGKTDYALEIAQKKGSYIINADALQIYYDLSTLTARPLDVQNIPHFLFGFLAPHEDFNVMTWYQKVSKIIQTHGDNYILVGGTVFYVKTWLEGGLSEIPEIPEEIKHNVRQLSKEQLHAHILKYDPDLFTTLHPNDTQRLTRALEVKLATGKSLKAFQIGAEKKKDIPVHVMDVTKEGLHQRIHLRTKQMMQNGAIDEVATLLDKQPNLINLPIKRVIGVTEIVDYLKGHITKEEMIEKVILLTNQYAKRQLTFCRKLLSAL